MTYVLYVPMATNVVLRVVVIDLRSAKAFSFHNRSSPNFAYTYGDNIVHNRTMTYFQAKT